MLRGLESVCVRGDECAWRARAQATLLIIPRDDTKSISPIFFCFIMVVPNYPATQT